MYSLLFIVLLITPYAHAASLFGCMCGETETTTTTVIRIDSAHTQHTRASLKPASIDCSRSSGTLSAPRVRPCSSTASARPTPTPDNLASILRPSHPTPATVLVPYTPLSPSIPLSPITPLSSDSSPSSPQSPCMPDEPHTPLFDEGRIITYPPAIQEERGKARFAQATALAQALINEINSILKNEQHAEQAHEDFYYRLSYQANRNSYSIDLTSDRLAQLAKLIPLDGHLTEEQAEAIIKTISVKLGGMRRSLQQEIRERAIKRSLHS